MVYSITDLMKPSVVKRKRTKVNIWDTRVRVVGRTSVRRVQPIGRKYSAEECLRSRVYGY